MRKYKEAQPRRKKNVKRRREKIYKCKKKKERRSYCTSRATLTYFKMCVAHEVDGQNIKQIFFVWLIHIRYIIECVCTLPPFWVSLKGRNKSKKKKKAKTVGSLFFPTLLVPFSLFTFHFSLFLFLLFSFHLIRYLFPTSSSLLFLLRSWRSSFLLLSVPFPFPLGLFHIE